MYHHQWSTLNIQIALFSNCILQFHPIFNNFTLIIFRSNRSEYNIQNMQQIYRRTPMPKSISIKLQSSFIKITHRYGCSPVNLLHFFGTPFTKNASGRLLLATVFVQGYLWTKLKLSQVPQSINKLKGTVTQIRIHSLLL